MTRHDLDVYRTVVDKSPTMIWRSALDGRRDYFNTTWLTFRGRSFQQEVGHGWIEGIHPDDAEDCLAIYRHHFDRREEFEAKYRLQRADGTYRSILTRARPVEDESGVIDDFIGSSLDIGEGHRRVASSAADDFFQMSLDNVCVAGFDGYFKRVNPSWSRTLGWTPEEFMARPIVDFVHPDDREKVFADRGRLKAGDDVGPIINRYRHKDGTYRWFEWRSVASLDKERVYAVARDITERKRAEIELLEARAREDRLQRQLIFADRMATVGTLAAGVAHEINNPLAFLTSNVTTMLRQIEALGAGGSEEPWPLFKEMVIDVQEGAARIQAIVKGLSTFSSSDDERLTALDIHHVLDMSVDMTLNELRPRARLVKDYAELPLVEADEARLGEVFINLLVNAAHAVPDGDPAANEVRIVTSTDSAGRAVIEVHDTGVGIAPAEIERVFDPFFTTKPVGVGTGLGLSICRNTVTGLGGELTVTSELGKGTIVRVLLPPSAPLR